MTVFPSQFTDLFFFCTPSKQLPLTGSHPIPFRHSQTCEQFSPNLSLPHSRKKTLVTWNRKLHSNTFSLYLWLYHVIRYRYLSIKLDKKRCNTFNRQEGTLVKNKAIIIYVSEINTYVPYSSALSILPDNNTGQFLGHMWRGVHIYTFGNSHRRNPLDKLKLHVEI